MLYFHPIDSFDDPELAPYQTLRRMDEHRQQGIFVAEGDKVVQRLIASGLPIVSVMLPEERRAEFELLLQTRTEDIPVYLGKKKLLEQLTGFPLYQGVMAVGRIPPPPSLSDLLAQATPPRLFVALDGLSNSENLGAVVRNAAALGAQALITSTTCSSPWLRRAVRNSMGAIFQLPAVEVSSLAEALSALRQRGIRCVAAHPHADGQTLAAAQLADDCCLVFGSEGYGISPGVLAACDDQVAIPMANAVDSLNVASASAAFLYEASRQRAIRQGVR